MSVNTIGPVVRVNGKPAIARTFVTIPEDDVHCLLNALAWLREARPWAYGRLGEEQRAQIERIERQAERRGCLTTDT
jgi:hypothetical protein